MVPDTPTGYESFGPPWATVGQQRRRQHPLRTVASNPKETL